MKYCDECSGWYDDLDCPDCPSPDWNFASYVVLGHGGAWVVRARGRQDAEEWAKSELGGDFKIYHAQEVDTFL